MLNISAIRPSLRYFHTRMKQNGLASLPFDRIDQLLEQQTAIKSQFRKNGYIILTGPTTDHRLLFDVARLFGKIQSHIRSPNDGIVEIRNKISCPVDKQITSDLHFFAHTDGHYLEGIARKQDEIFRVTPPKIIALQCVKPAEEGGVSFFVDGKAMLVSMLKNHPSLISTLFTRNCTSIFRDNHLVMDLPVFKKLPSGRFSVRFSYDQDLYMPEWALKDLNFFNEHYILNPVFATSFSLKEKQILILDNHRHLHGRTSIKGERIFRRIWVQDEVLSTKMSTLRQDLPYYRSNEAGPHSLIHYQPYAAIEDCGEPRFHNVPVGIELLPKVRSKIEELIPKS